MEFTTDWFSHNAPSMRASLTRLDRVHRVLEIGCWEGRSTCWFLEAFPGCTVTCVDTWEGSAEHEAIDMAAVEARFLNNVSGFGDRVDVRKGRSDRVLFGMTPGSFDAAYVDGSHECPDALSDIIMAYHLVRPGGVLLIDDYTVFAGVRHAVDRFVASFSGLVHVIHNGQQVHLQKL